MTNREAIERLVTAIEGLVQETKILSQRVYACERSIIEGDRRHVVEHAEKTLEGLRDTAPGGRSTGE